MLVGWFWSIAWGGLMLTYALQYRQATKEKRQAVVATAALEAFTNDMLLRRRDIHKLVQKHKTPKQKQKEADAAAAAEAAHVKHAQMNTHTLRFGSKNAADVELGIRGTVTLATTIAQPVTNETHEESSKKHEKVKKKKKEAKKSVKFKK